MDVEQRGDEIGIGRIDLLVKEISPLYMAQNAVSSQESRCEESF